MRGVVIAMALLLSGCCGLYPGTGAQPTATLRPVCTPPPCDFEAGEVYYCPGECPGGCGTTCATATPAPITSQPATPRPVCTPPPCDFEAGEVYHCPDVCPGGCGTICATATPSS